MYKATQDNKDYLERVASHSTKESRTGLIRAIPEWAQEPEDYYNSILERWKLILEQLTATQAKLAEYNAMLKTTLPRKEYEHIKIQQASLREKHNILQEQQVEYRPIAIAAGEKAWFTVFFHVARKMLRPDDYILLISETKSILGRDVREISKAISTNERFREKQKRMKKRKKRKLQSLSPNCFWGTPKLKDKVIYSEDKEDSK